MSRIVGIYIGKTKDEHKSPVISGELITNHGLSGDRHAGIDPHRQVSLFSNEVFNQLIVEGFTLIPNALSANLFTEGIDLDNLISGDRLRIGNSIIEVVEPRTPCKSITKINNKLPKRLYGHCGQLARVLTGSVIHIDDEIEFLKEKNQ